MDLDAYMKKERIKNVTMAKDLKLTDGFISKLRKKKATPTLFNAFSIIKYCQFQVSLPELASQKSFDLFVERKQLNKFDLESINLKY